MLNVHLRHEVSTFFYKVLTNLFFICKNLEQKMFLLKTYKTKYFS